MKGLLEAKKVLLLSALALGAAGCGLLEEAVSSASVEVEGPYWLETARYEVLTPEGGSYQEGEAAFWSGRARFRVRVPQGGRLKVEGRRGGFTYYEASVESLTPGQGYFLILGSEERKKLSLSYRFSGLEGFPGSEIQVCAEAPVGASGVQAKCGAGYELLVRLTETSGQVELPAAPWYRIVAYSGSLLLAMAEVPLPGNGSLEASLLPRQKNLSVQGPSWLARVTYALETSSGPLGEWDLSGGWGSWSGVVPSVKGARLVVRGYAQDSPLPYYSVEVPDRSSGSLSAYLDESNRVLLRPSITLVGAPQEEAFTIAVCAQAPTGWPALGDGWRFCPGGHDLLAKLFVPPEGQTVTLPLMGRYTLRLFADGAFVGETVWEDVASPVWTVHYGELSGR